MAAPKKPSRRARCIVLAVALVLALAVPEGLARHYTTSASNLMPAFRMRGGVNCALLPLRPTAAALDDWEQRSGRARFIVQDPELGWTVARSARAELRDPIGRPLVYESNAQGLRAAPERTYGHDIPAGVTRMVVCGDSFTFGADLPLEETWVHKLEQRTEGLEIVNLGVQAYGTDQAYLRWQKHGKPFDADVVALVIWPEDILRNLNVFRYFLKPRAGFLMVKPRYLLTQQGLELVNSPVPDPARCSQLLARMDDPLFEHERWRFAAESEPSPLYASRLLHVLVSMRAARERQLVRQRFYDESQPEAMDLAVRIAREFQADVHARGAEFIAIVLPQQDLLGVPLPLAARLEAAGIKTVDLFPAFERHAQPLELFFPSGHFDEEGTDVVAEELAETLFGRSRS